MEALAALKGRHVSTSSRTFFNALGLGFRNSDSYRLTWLYWSCRRLYMVCGSWTVTYVPSDSPLFHQLAPEKISPNPAPKPSPEPFTLNPAIKPNPSHPSALKPSVL